MKYLDSTWKFSCITMMFYIIHQCPVNGGKNAVPFIRSMLIPSGVFAQQGDSLDNYA